MTDDKISKDDIWYVHGEILDSLILHYGAV
jgi:hypothetical protein